MRLLERNQNLEKDDEDQSKDDKDKSHTAKLKIWFKIDGSNKASGAIMYLGELIPEVGGIMMAVALT